MINVIARMAQIREEAKRRGEEIPEWDEHGNLLNTVPPLPPIGFCSALRLASDALTLGTTGGTRGRRAREAPAAPR